MAARFESLNKLFESLRDTSHDFRITTNPFPPLDPEKLTRSLDVEAKGTENGKHDIPTASAKDFDDVERTMVERVESQRDASYQIMEDQLSTFSTRLRNLDFDGHFGQIQIANHSSVNDFRADVAGGRDELHGLRKGLREADVELADFRERNGLEKRVARTKSSTATAMKWLMKR